MAKPIDPVKARNCSLLNLLGTPGLGSLMGGRIVEGVGQLLLAVAGFCLVIYWFVKVLSGAFSEQDAESHSYAVWGFAGGGLFILAWLWSLLTSLALLRDAKKSATDEPQPEPPRIQ